MLRSPNSLWVILILIALLGLAACSTPQTTFEPKSDAAERTHAIYILLTIMATLVGAGILGAMAYVMIRFRAKPGKAPSTTHGHVGLEILWTLLPAAVLVFIAVPSVMALAEEYRDPDPGALKITATGHQWWWEFEYEGLGPDGGPLITANELHLPLGQQVSIELLSNDVIHSFWVPQLVGKADVLPGRTTTLEPFTPKEIGVYYGQCAEFCGTAHALMRFRVIVEPLARFEHWATALQSAPDDPTSELAAAGKSLFFGRATCFTCHSIAGTLAQGKTAPDLSRFGSRLTLAAGSLENTPTNAGNWIYDLRSLKPIPDNPLAMPSFGELSDDDPRKLTRDEASAIAAYLLEMKVE